MAHPAARSLAFAVFLAAATAAPAHDDDKPSAAGLGKVKFDNSCSPAVQEKLQRGVAMLHSFYYTAAERAFEEVGAEDNSCVIAAWGFANEHHTCRRHPLPWHCFGACGMQRTLCTATNLCGQCFQSLGFL